MFQLYFLNGNIISADIVFSVQLQMIRKHMFLESCIHLKKILSESCSLYQKCACRPNPSSYSNVLTRSKKTILILLFLHKLQLHTNKLFQCPEIQIRMKTLQSLQFYTVCNLRNITLQGYKTQSPPIYLPTTLNRKIFTCPEFLCCQVYLLRKQLSIWNEQYKNV